MQVMVLKNEKTIMCKNNKKMKKQTFWKIKKIKKKSMYAEIFILKKKNKIKYFNEKN